MVDQGKTMIFDEENNKMVTVDEYFDSIYSSLRLRYYKCTDIETVYGKRYNMCIVGVPMIDLSEAVDRQENLAAITGCLEKVVGEVERFNVEEHTYAN